MSFEFRETMAGSYHLLDAPDEERPISFTIRARSLGLRSFFARPEVEIAGELDAEGFADHRMLRGTLGLDLLRKGTLDYGFAFAGNDRQRYRFEGHKTVSVLDPVESMTLLPGKILGARGDEIALAVLRFDVRHDMLKFLRSWRLL